MQRKDYGQSASQLPGAAWRKSSFSGHQGNCVEVATLAAGEIAVRNSRFPTGPALVFGTGEWAAFVAGVGQDEFAS